MVETNDLERELTALAEMRLRWRHEPDMVGMIDRGMALMSTLLKSPNDDIEEQALAISGLMGEVFAKVQSIRVH